MNHDEIEVFKIYRFLVQQKLAILPVLIVFLIAAVAAILLITPKYKAETWLLYVQPQGERRLGTDYNALLGPGSALASGLGLASQNPEQQAIALITSDAELVGFARHAKLLSSLFADRVNESTGKWRKEGDGEPTDWEIARRLDTRLSASFDGKTGLIRIRLLWEDPVLASNILRQYVAYANDIIKQRALKSNAERLAYLEREITNSKTVEARSAIANLLEFEIERAMLLELDSEYALQTLAKAVPPDPDEFEWPNRKLFLATAIFLGLIFGVFAGYVRALATAWRGGKPDG